VQAFILGAIATPLNLIFDIFYLVVEFATEFLVPVLDVLGLVFFAQAAAFLWIAVRARRVKKLLLPNSFT
jgi:nicotinamide riboside transporter PnuC